MKTMKKAAVFLLAAAVMVTTAGCGAAKRSGQIKLNYAELVPEVCDYKKIPLTFTVDYTVKDKDVEDMISNLLLGYGAGTVKITDREIVEKTDLVLVDYTGYLNGEAFDRGADKDVLLDVANNSTPAGMTFIDGFTDGLVGAKVGTTVSSKVKFPEKYSNADLAGKETVFEFNVKEIHRPKTISELSDEDVSKIFGQYNITTVKGLREYVEDYLKSNAESQIYSEKIDGVRDYVLENSKVNMPEEYLKLRLKEYINSMKEEFCTEGQSLEDYITSQYDMTYEEAEKEWSDYMESQVKLELIICRIAELEKIKLKEDVYEDYIKSFLTNSNYDFATEKEIYEYFGNGNVKEGKTYLRQLFLVNQTLDELVDNVEITYDIKEEK